MGIFGNTFGLPHLIIILVIILLLFGAPKLPGLARSVGQSMKIFRNEIKDPAKSTDAENSADSVENPEAPTSTASAVKSESASAKKSKNS